MPMSEGEGEVDDLAGLVGTPNQLYGGYVLYPKFVFRVAWLCRSSEVEGRLALKKFGKVHPVPPPPQKGEFSGPLIWGLLTFLTLIPDVHNIHTECGEYYVEYFIPTVHCYAYEWCYVCKVCGPKTCCGIFDFVRTGSYWELSHALRSCYRKDYHLSFRIDAEM